MNSPDTRPGDDLRALAWVHGELRRSLEAAHKALRRYLKEAAAARGSDVDAVDPAVLRTARTHLHQGVGALELVGLPAAADVLRASEAAVQRMAQRPAMVDTAAVDTIEHVSFALLDFLGRQLAGKAVTPLMLFPQYRAAQQLAGADRIHPADLWKIDWQWRELSADPAATPRGANDGARGDMETLVLALMREPGSAALARMSDLCADLGAGARQGASEAPHMATFWQLAAAVFEAQAAGLLVADVHVKRIASRLMAQLRTQVRGQHDVSDRLAQDLLFFCWHAKAPSAEQPAARLAAVRRAWNLADVPAVDYETARLGRFDPSVLALARKRVAAAKDSWSAVAGGELHRMAGLAEQFSLVGESLQRVFPHGEVLDQALQTAVMQTVAGNAPPPPTLAMEVATAILYLDASLEDGEFDHPALAERVQRLAQRIDDVRTGAEPHPLDAWMEELYRRVSDRQTMGSVVHELRSSLSEVEKQIDQYFRDPAQRHLLIPVPAQLSAMRGVLSVLGLDQASAAVLHMRGDVDALAQTEVEPQLAIQAGSFDRLADNLGALSFLIDMLSVQPGLAKSLFRYDPETGNLSAVMGQSGRVSAFAALDEQPAQAATQATRPAASSSTGAAPLLDRLRELAAAADEPGLSDAELAERIEPLTQHALAADQPELARLLGGARVVLRAGGDEAARRQVRAELAQAVARLAPPSAPAAPASAPIPPPKPAQPGATGLEDDAEMREIFIEEAREVVTDARAALERLADAPESAGDMTVVRRAFHTLKGSSRMVGLREFGDAAWACEQLYNARLASAPRMDGGLRQFTAEALAYMDDWTEAIASRQDRGHDALAVASAADALREGSAPVPITLPAVVAVEAVPARPPESALGLGFELPPEEVPEEAPEAAREAVPVLTEPASAWPFEPAPEPQAASAIGDGLDFDFDLGPAADETLPPAVESLAARLPDLPSAADLDLGLPPLTATPAGEPAPATELKFDFDLGDLGAPPAAPPPAERIEPAAEPGLLDLPLDTLPAAPMPEGETLEIDFADLGDLFGPAAAEPPVLNVDTAALADLPLDLVEPVDRLPDTMPMGLEPEAPSAADEGPVAGPGPLEAAPPAIAAEPEPEREPEPALGEDEPVKLIGPLRISIPLFNIYLNEADELSRRLGIELAEWAHEHERHAVPDSSVALAHSLAGSSATVGYADLSALARALEHALMRSRAQGPGRAGEPELFNHAADEIRHLLHQFAAGFLRPVDGALMDRLAAHERLPLSPVSEAAAAESEARPAPVPVSHAAPPVDDEIDATDAIDAELFPIFEDEADELLPQLQSRLRDWHGRPGDQDAAMACMRTLHTLKGGARLAGAMRLGEMSHRLETKIEALASRGDALATDVEPLLARADAMSAAFDGLRKPSAPAVVPTPAPVAEAAELPPTGAVEFAPAPSEAPAEAAAIALPAAEEKAAVAALPPAIDWQRFRAEADLAATAAERPSASGAVVRVRAGLLDRMVNQAGEVSIVRARIDSDVKLLQGSLGELTDSLERMRRQLRDIELQAETQISSRMEAAKSLAQAFDPLEMDRFTRFQELTRFMAESVNDVATLQRSLQRTLQSAEDELAAQARLTRELQDDLLRTRMVEFESLADRLYRTARQAAKETDKQVRLDIVGGAIEIDRGVLERMAGPFEHLLRNCVAHGVEAPDLRTAAGKDAVGTITITAAQAGNEVAVEFADDGAGLDLARIRERAIERGMLAADAAASDAELGEFIFSARLQHRAHGDRAGRARRRPGCGAGRSQRDGWPHRDPERSRPGHALPVAAAADHRGDPDRDVALRRAAGGRAIDAGGERAPGHRHRAHAGLRRGQLRLCRRAHALLLARRLAADRPARPDRRPVAHGGRRAQRIAACGGACRRGRRQPGGGGQERRPATGADAGSGRGDPAALGRGGADLQPGGVGQPVRRRGTRRHARGGRTGGGTAAGARARRAPPW